MCDTLGNLDSAYLKAAYPVSLSLSPSTTLSGTSSGNTSLGKFNPTNLKITLVGSYTLKAECTDSTLAIQYVTTPITVISLTSFAFSLSEISADTYFDVQLSASLKDNNGDAYTTITSVTISDSTGSMVGTFSGSSTNTGTVSFTVYFTTSGDKNVIFSSGTISNTIKVVVTKSKLVLAISNISSGSLDDSTDTFTLTATVWNSGQTTIETTHGPHSIALTLIATVSGNSGLVLGGYTSAVNSDLGVVAFNSLSILSKGTFQIKATSSGLTDGLTNTYTITTHIKTITVSSSLSSVSIYTYASIDVKVYGSDDKYYLTSISVTLVPATASSIVNSFTTKTTSSGYVSFTIYSTAIGSNAFSTSPIDSILSNSFNINFLAPVLRCVFENPAVKYI